MIGGPFATAFMISRSRSDARIRNDAMSVQNAYDEWAITYDADRNRTRDLDAQVTRQLLGERRYTTILELGCGTGKNTAMFAHMADRVVALDFSEAMITRAKAKLSDGLVLFALADLTRSWPCADQSVDLATCNLVLEHVADLGFIFGQAGRVLSPNGQFFVSELHPFRQYQGKKAVYQSGEGQVEIPAFVHHISDFLKAADVADFMLVRLNEWWHADDRELPRLISFLFQKRRV
jgi:malonyl-CoA O-methyltransferase